MAISTQCEVHLEKAGKKTTDLSLKAMLHTHAKIDPTADRICHFGLTGAFVEFACLCDIPFAQSGSLANGWSHSVHIVAWQDGVQEDSSVIQQERD